VQFVGEHGREIVVVFTSLMDTAPRTLTLAEHWASITTS
jgi:hypothetical protein